MHRDPVTRAPEAFGRRLFGWIVGTGHPEEPEVRASLLQTVRETSQLMALALFWTQAGALGTWYFSGARWAIVWSAFDLALFGLRVFLRWRFDQAIFASTRPRYGAMLTANAVWLVSIALGSYGALKSDDIRVMLLGVFLTVGFSGYITSRSAAFPRFAIASLYLLAGCLSVGLMQSAFADAAMIGWLSPGVAVAFHTLLKLNHAILLDALRARQENRRLSMHDPLTGLPNRLMLRERLTHLCRQLSNERAHAGFAVIGLDLDGFKAVNDRHGHAAGDWLLKVVAERLARTVRLQDLVCRTGGDEFLIVLPGANAKIAAEAAERTLAALSQPCDLGGMTTAQIGASLGIALAPSDGRDPDTLLASADANLYAIKRSGKGAWRMTASVDMN